MSETTERDLSIQNDFFNQSRKLRTRVTIFLTTGKRLVGRIKSFDRFTLILDAGGGAEEMVFKHAIATISTSSRPPSYEQRGGEGRSPRTEVPPQGPREGASREPVPVTQAIPVTEAIPAASTSEPSEK
jgi:host factor-I protein